MSPTWSILLGHTVYMLQGANILHTLPFDFFLMEYANHACFSWDCLSLI